MSTRTLGQIAELPIVDDQVKIWEQGKGIAHLTVLEVHAERLVYLEAGRGKVMTTRQEWANRLWLARQG